MKNKDENLYMLFGVINMIKRNKECISAFLEGEIEYVEEKLLYVFFSNGQVTYLVNNSYYKDIQMGDEFVAFLLQNKPKNINEYISRVYRQYRDGIVERAIKALYTLGAQGIVELKFDELGTEIYYKGYSIIGSKENNILKIQRECLEIDGKGEAGRCCVQNKKASVIFDGHFMRKEIFSFRYDYFIFSKENKKSIVVVENISNGSCIVRYINTPQEEFAEVLEMFILVEFSFNKFCNQIRMEIPDMYVYENSTIGGMSLFRKYMELIEGRDKHIVYGYQVLRENGNDR